MTTYSLGDGDGDGLVEYSVLVRVAVEDLAGPIDCQCGIGVGSSAFLIPASLQVSSVQLVRVHATGNSFPFPETPILDFPFAPDAATGDAFEIISLTGGTWFGFRAPGISDVVLPTLLPCDYYALRFTFDFLLDDLDALAEAPLEIGVGSNADYHPIETTMVGEFPGDTPTAVRLVGFRAGRVAADDEGSVSAVRLTWRTGHEVDHLGFHVYRDDGRALQRLTEAPIPGSALAVVPSTPLTAGRRYQFLDDQPGHDRKDRYWLEELALDGERRWHGPVAVQLDGREAERAPLEPASMSSSNVCQADPMPSRDAERSAPLRLGTDPTQQRLAGSPGAVKLMVEAEGWYRVERDQLVAAGLDPAAEPRTLQLFVDGVEIPIELSHDGDSIFESGESISFFGRGLDSPWSDRRVYWLAPSPDGATGLRLPTVGPYLREPVPPRTFSRTVRLEERHCFSSGVLNGEAENWFGDLVDSGGVDQLLNLPALGNGVDIDARLRLSLQGLSTGEHHVEIRINDSPLGDVRFTGREWVERELSISHALLTAGENRVTLRSAGSFDWSLVDSIELTYRSQHQADGDRLRFTATEREQIDVHGFLHPDIDVLDVTDPETPARLDAGVERRGKSYTVSTSKLLAGTRELLAVAAPGRLAPVEIRPNHESSWLDYQGAGLVIVTHGELTDAAEQLANARRAEGWSVAVVDIEDVWDESAFGHKSPHALRSFLSRAAETWPIAPTHVLLLGDATVDPKGYRLTTSQRPDRIPTGHVTTTAMETSSDDFLVDFDDDGLADLAIGRLPALDAEDAAGMVARTLAYADADAGASWARRVLLVADDHGDDPEDTFDFTAATRALEQQMPADLDIERLELAALDVQAARRDLVEALNGGQAVVHYFGHGQESTWASEGLFTTSSAAALSNGERRPLVVALTCANGYFTSLFAESLAAELLRSPGGGAVAVWASSGVTDPGPQLVAAQRLAEQLWSADTPTLGEAVRRAKAAVADDDLRRTWMLLGDPTLRLVQPTETPRFAGRRGERE